MSITPTDPAPELEPRDPDLRRLVEDVLSMTPDERLDALRRFAELKASAVPVDRW